MHGQVAVAGKENVVIFKTKNERNLNPAVLCCIIGVFLKTKSEDDKSESGEYRAKSV